MGLEESGWKLAKPDAKPRPCCCCGVELPAGEQMLHPVNLAAFVWCRRCAVLEHERVRNEQGGQY